MSNAFKFLPAIIFFLALGSCAFVSFEELDAKISVQEKQTHYKNEYVKIDFSFGMEKPSVENLISLKKDGQRLSTKIEWQDNSCLVKAAGSFKKGCKYELSLQGDVYANDGRKYSLNLYREFTFGGEDEAFNLIGVEEKKDLNGDIKSLVFLFNKAADAAYFEREFTLSPYVEAKKEWSKDFLSVEIWPKDKWKANVFYDWSLGNIFSQDGVKIFKDFKGSFLGAKKEKVPKLLKVCPAIGETFLESQKLDDLLESQAVGFVFDCEMNAESIERGIYFTPSVQGYWKSVDGRRFAFTPYNNYKSNEEYRIAITDAVEDKWGIKFSEEQNIFFKTKTDFIKIQSASFNTEELKKDVINQLKIDKDCPAYIRIVFSKNLSQKSLAEIKSAVKFEGVFPPSVQNPKMDSLNVISPNCLEISYSNISAAALEQECLYKLTVKGGEKFVYDGQNECLKEDECFYMDIREKN